MFLICSYASDQRKEPDAVRLHLARGLPARPPGARWVRPLPYPPRLRCRRPEATRRRRRHRGAAPADALRKMRKARLYGCRVLESDWTRMGGLDRAAPGWNADDP